MMSKRIMASCLALSMVLGMSLNSFAALRNNSGSTTIIVNGVGSNVPAGPGQSTYTLPDGTIIHERSTRHVSIADFVRLRDVCNEKYGASLVKKVSNNGVLEGTAEPVGSDVTDPETYDEVGNALQKPLTNRTYVGRTVDQRVYGPDRQTVNNVQLKLQSMHDYVSQGNKIRFVNGVRLSDTEFVIRVDCDIQDTDPKAPQSFRGDYYVSVLPYKERVTGTHYENNVLVEDTEPVEVPDEFGDKYNNKMFGPAWFFCMLFDETQPVGKQDIIGYLVARRITRWPDWNDTRFYYPGANNLRKVIDGVEVFKANPTQIARESATVYDMPKDRIYDEKTGRYLGSKTTWAQEGWSDKGTEMKDPRVGDKEVQPNGQKKVVRSAFYDVAVNHPNISYAYPAASIADKEAKTDWLDSILAKNRAY